MNQRLKLYTFDNYYEYEWLWCGNWNQGRYWDHALKPSTVSAVVNAVGSWFQSVIDLGKYEYL